MKYLRVDRDRAKGQPERGSIVGRPTGPPPTTSRGRVAVALLVVIFVLSACGSIGDTLEEAADSVDEDDAVAADSDDGEADAPDPADGPGFGEAIEADVALTGATPVSYATGDADTLFVVAGGCIPAETPTFGVNLQVLDTTEEALGGGDGVTAAHVTGSVEADLAGGSTGTFDLEDLQVTVFDPPGDLAAGQEYRGQGVLDITVHDAPAELTERRMNLTISGEGLSGDAGEVDLQVDLVWVMGCT